MKKWISMLLVLVMLLGLCACGAVKQGVEQGLAEANKADETDPPAETSEPATAESAAPESDDELTLVMGDLLDLSVNDDNVAVVKAKITSSLTNKQTVDKNYYNVADLIKNHGFDQYDEIQYWAVADMSDGSEQKCVSFTVPKSTIDMVAEQGDRFPDNTLGEYVTDLWILPSLSD